AKRSRRPAWPEAADAESTDRLLRYEAALQPLRKARGGLPDMPGWVLCIIGVTLALTFMASAGLPGAWNGMRHYQDGKARLATLDYAGCASEMEQAVEAVPTSPKAWAYQAYGYLLDKDAKAGLSPWHTDRRRAARRRGKGRRDAGKHGGVGGGEARHTVCGATRQRDGPDQLHPRPSPADRAHHPSLRLSGGRRSNGAPVHDRPPRGSRH